MTHWPKNFFWGVAVSSHQTEGNNNNDWTEWEKDNAHKLAKEATGKFAKRSPVWESVKQKAENPDNYISGQADQSFEKWQEDLQLLKELGVNAYRFSIEWSRVQPDSRTFDEAVIEHYKQIIIELKSNGIEPFVTILHRALPLWVEKQGGWSHLKTLRDFEKYTKKLAQSLGGLVTYWTPLNEPILNVAGGFVAGLIPPGRKNIFAGLLAYHHMAEAHKQAHRILHAYNPHAQVGTAHAGVLAYPEHNAWYNRFSVKLLHYLANWKFLNAVRHHTDFIGIQYYTRGVLGFRKSKWLIPIPQEIHQNSPASDMGQEIYPQGLYDFAKLTFQKYKKPIIVTENGIASIDDQKRIECIKAHTTEVEKLLRDGIQVQGYFHWSLLDNFEWDKGFWPKFGLVEVDRKTFTRTPKPSFTFYKNFIEENL